MVGAPVLAALAVWGAAATWLAIVDLRTGTLPTRIIWSARGTRMGPPVGDIASRSRTAGAPRGCDRGGDLQRGTGAGALRAPAFDGLRRRPSGAAERNAVRLVGLASRTARPGSRIPRGTSRGDRHARPPRHPSKPALRPPISSPALPGSPLGAASQPDSCPSETNCSVHWPEPDAIPWRAAAGG